MATTTFSGPIKSGTIKATTGTAIGELKNTGTVATQQVSVKISCLYLQLGLLIQ